MDMELEEKINDAINKIMDSETRFFGMTYEDGVRHALEWVLNDCDDESNPSNEYD